MLKDYEKNAYPYRRRSAIRAFFELYDLTAKDMAASVTSESPISMLDQSMDLTENRSYRINTMEPGNFLLDGNGKLPDAEDLGQVGWESGNFSDENGIFDPPEVYNRYQAMSTHSSAGFELFFDEPVRDFKVETYKNGELVSSDMVEDNTEHMYRSMTAAPDYDRLVVTFYRSAMPHHRVKLVEIKAGRKEIFDRGNIRSGNIKYECDPLCEALPSNELVVTVDNTEGIYNMINPDGLYSYLQKGQKLVVEMGTADWKDEIEYLPAGTFYYTSSSTDDEGLIPTAQITAHDVLWSFDAEDYTGGSLLEKRLEDVLMDIVGDRIALDIPDDIAARVIPAGIYGVKKREAIRLAVQAARATCWVSRLDTLRVRDFEEGDIVERVGLNRMYKPAAVAIIEPVDTVEVKATDIRSVVGTSVVKTLYQNIVPVYGVKTIDCEVLETCTDLSVTLTGGTLVGDPVVNVRTVSLTIEASESVDIKITGKSTVTSQTVFKVSSESAAVQDLAAADAARVKTLVNALVKADLADPVARWLLDKTQNRVEDTLDERGNPAREIGDTIVVSDPFGENQMGVERREDWTFNGKWLRLSSSQRGKMTRVPGIYVHRYAGALYAGDFG